MRIISGKAKGLRLGSVKGLQTRPTADRVKEALFNILGPAVAGSSFLDLYAGNGGVGLEALSRGASQVVWVDSDPRCSRMIRSNLVKTGLEGGGVYTKEVLSALGILERKGESFDFIFLDPPYSQGLVRRTLLLLDHSPLLRDGGKIIAEGGKKEDAPRGMSKIKMMRKEHYGDTALFFYQHEEELR